MKLAGLLLAALAVSAQDTNIDKYIDALRDGCNNVIDKGPYSARIKKKFPLKFEKLRKILRRIYNKKSCGEYVPGYELVFKEDRYCPAVYECFYQISKWENYFLMCPKRVEKINKTLGRWAGTLINQLYCPNSYRHFWTGPHIGYSYFWNGPEPEIFKDSTIQISNVCDADFVDSEGWNCTYTYEGGFCDDTAGGYLAYAVNDGDGYKTVLNCPQCGCGPTAAHIPDYDEFGARISGQVRVWPRSNKPHGP